VGYLGPDRDAPAEANRDLAAHLKCYPKHEAAVVPTNG
jgi:hypothetical protein